MSESKFLPFQDADGNLHNDECEIEEIVVEQKVCSACKPNEGALVPDWRRAADPFLNERNCKYQVSYRTRETNTGYSPQNSDEENEDALDSIYRKYEDEAIVKMLEFYNKETTVGAIALVRESIEYTNFNLPPRNNSKIKLLYSVPFDIINAIGPAAEDEEDPEETGDIEVTYQTADLQEKILRVRKGLRLYNRYYKIFSITADEVQRFRYVSGPSDGKEFILKNYGDYGLGINPGNKRAKLELVYKDLIKFLKDRGYALRPDVGIGFKEPISEITFSFNREYEIQKISFKTEECGIKPVVYTKKLKILKNLDGWKDRTAVGYFAQLDAMDNDLRARTPKPWVDFITEYTYPRVALIGVNQGIAGEPTAAGCVAQAITNKVFDGSILDAAEEFSISDALVAKWYDTYCNSSVEELADLKTQLGILSGGGELRDLYTTAQAQAYDILDIENDPFSLLCLTNGREEFNMPTILADLKVCGLEAALTQAITCLFGGLTLEQSLSKVAEAALKGMDIRSFYDLFIGLPPEQRRELDALAKKKVEEGDLFEDRSTNQEVSDAIAGNNFETLTELVGRLSDKDFRDFFRNEDDDPRDRVDGWFESGAIAQPDPNAKKRTLAERFDNPSGSFGKQTVLAAYTSALLEYYSSNLLDLVDQLNRFPGARLISNAIIAIDCPRPPLFNPTVFDFIRDLELPFCRNMDDITLPKLVNPFAWVGSISDIFAALFAALKEAISELIIAILVKLFIKICELFGDAICKAIETTGDIVSGLVTDGGISNLSNIIRDSICGVDVNQEEINNSIVEMFANFGVGAAAFADREQTLALAESMANVMTQRELSNAFLGEMSPEATALILEIIESEYPQFSGALSNENEVSQMFASMGELFPPDFKSSLKDLVEGIGQEDSRPVNPTLCATPEALEEFCSIRADILQGRASPDQIAKLCGPEPNELRDLQSILDGGIENYLANNMPPITSDPGCDNGLLPYEPEETINATTAGLGNDLEMLMVDYTKDMIGNGPLERNWGMVNMIMSDTEGNPLTTHIRKANLNPFYVDEYGTFFPDPKVVFAAGLVNPIAGIALNALDQGNKTGAYPTKVAAYLQSYMNGDIDNLINVNYSNSAVGEKSILVEAGSNIGAPFVSDAAYDTTATYIYSPSNGGIESIKVTTGARKIESDIKLSFDDNADGRKQLGESEYQFGLDVEAYTAEVEDSSGTTVNIYSDNMRVKISERINLSSLGAYAISSLTDPSFAEGVKFREGKIEPEGSPENIFETKTASTPNMEVDVDTDVEFQFLSIDDTFSEMQETLEEYERFQSCFTSRKAEQPQSILLQEMLEKESNEIVDISMINDYRNITTKNILDEIFKTVANVNGNVTAWDYGAEAESLNTEDTEYGINDNGTWVLYKDTGLTDEDMVLGISFDQYKNEVSGTLDKTRVFFLDPNQFGGTYRKPAIYIKPPEFKGWLGFVDVLFPEFSPCKPNSSNLVDFDSIKEKIDEIYPNIPEDDRLKSNPDCIVELPYNRVLERPAKAAMIGLIIAACRIYASAHIIKALPTFTKFSPRFPEVFSSAYASYIVEDMQKSFKSARGADWELLGGFTDEEFWYGFLEQCVQMYSYRVDIGDVEPPQAVIQALMRLNDLQEDFDYTKDREDGRPDIGFLQTLKNYREEKNFEAIEQTQADAKIVMKEWVSEQLNYMSQKLITSLDSIGFSPDVKDIDYYLMEKFSAGSRLNINSVIDAFGTVTAAYPDLPTVPYEDNPDAMEAIDGLPAYYTFGGEFVVKENKDPELGLEVGQEFIGAYHIHINESGDVIYMAGARHRNQPHNVITPMINSAQINIGDVADIGTTFVFSEKPFLIEKYISIDGVKMTTGEAIAKINSNPDLSKLISDIYPGTMKLKFATDLKNQTVIPQGEPIGIEGELGVRYGVKFSVIIDGKPIQLATEEMDALDLPLKDFKTLSANSYTLFCLLKHLKNNPKFKLFSRYIISSSKLTSLTAIYNDMTLLPSIGQITVKKKNLFNLDVGAVLENTAGVLPPVVNTVLEEIETKTVPRPEGAWAHRSDRSNRKGLLVLSWDNWDRELLVNSTSRIKKLFKTYYNSRDFDPEQISKSTDGPGKIFEKSLRDIFRPAPGRQLLPWFMRRRLRNNPFNSLGEICKKEDT